MNCPLCNLNVDNIISHYKIHDYNVKNKNDFLKLYPEWNQPFHVDKRQKGNYKCPFCEKTYLLNNGLSVHIKKHHPDEWKKKIKEKQKTIEEKGNKTGQLCKICNKITFDLKQHVERTHNILWEVYCKTYNHDILKTKIISEEHKQNLSKNKKRFYNETERGKQLKQEQSIKWTGENNIIHYHSILEKAINNRAKNGGIPNYAHRGIHCYYNLIDRYTRSFEELKFIILLELNNVKFEYEPKFSLKYYNTEKNFISTYIPDFYINGVYYELKTIPEYNKCISNLEITKYFEISKAFKLLNDNFEIITINLFAKNNNLLYNENTILEKITNEYNNGNILFTCKNNSRIIKQITKNNSLKELKGVSLYD